jgi:hypothetical protein
MLHEKFLDELKYLFINTPISEFDVELYLNTYEDVRNCYGKNRKAVIFHYFKFGRFEGRKGFIKLSNDNLVFAGFNYQDSDFKNQKILKNPKFLNQRQLMYLDKNKIELFNINNNVNIDFIVDRFINFNEKDYRNKNSDIKGTTLDIFLYSISKNIETIYKNNLKIIDNLEINNFDKTKKILSISHNFGGGTQTYINNLAKLYNFTEINIIDQNQVTISSKLCSYKDIFLLIGPDSYILLHHLLYFSNENKIHKEIFYDICNKCKYNKLIFIIHDYHLLFPKMPNPIKSESINCIPSNVDLEFTKYVFSKSNLIIFNSKNCLNNYNRFLNMKNFNYIITNSTPDIVTINYNLYQPEKKIYNIGILGHIFAKHKGLNLIKKISDILPDNKFIIKIFGSRNDDLPKPDFYKKNVQLYGKYNNNHIFEIIDKHDIDFFLFVSTFEETWSYTLSIAMQTGLPIFYNNIGAYSERLENRDNVYPYEEEYINKLPALMTNIGKNITQNKLRYPTKMEIFNRNSDFDWLLNTNNTFFNTQLTEHYLIHKNVCFIHFTNIGIGYEVFLEQINHIKKSGLYDKLDFIFVTILGKHIKLSSDPKVKVIYYSSNIKEWEFPTIKLIKSFADNVKYKTNILYIHTKGAMGHKNAENWRLYLEYFLINNHEDCLFYLKDGRDCVGVNINILPKRGPNKNRCHFSGNFWWANSCYLKSLNDTMIYTDRYSTEHFLLGNYHNKFINYISLHNCENNFYKQTLDPNFYTFLKIKNKVLNNYYNFKISNYNKIVCVYFISTINTGVERFFVQINEIINSGLYDACELILTFISGYNKSILDKLNTLNKIKIIQTKESVMESFSINNFRNYISFDKYNVVYLHTKGASHSLDNSYINDWCAICNYFTITLWKLNIILLNIYSCIGINLMSFPLPHFSGNHWWATSEHINNLKINIGNKYLDPEMYILNNVEIKNKFDKQFQPNPLCLYKSINNHAAANYNENIYKILSIEQIINKIPNNYIYNNIGDNNPVNKNRITNIEN